MKKAVLFFLLTLFVVPASFARGNQAVPVEEYSENIIISKYDEPSADYIYERPEKIVMIWDLIISEEDNHKAESKIVHSGLDVISPTWFCISSDDGDVSSLASREYVQWAHDNGILVWALFENKSNNILTYNALSDWEKRQRIIEQLISFAHEYGFDGINVNFEAMNRYTGILYELFIVELYKQLKPLGITLSIDTSLRTGETNRIYDTGLIARNSDYVVVMAYDQHDRCSPEIGPTAAIAWVRQGVEEILEIISPEKLILGIPFYSIVWIEDRRSGGKSSETMGMSRAHEMFERNPKIWALDRITEQIFAETNIDQTNYRTWLEDEHSISLKLDLVNDFNLAGLSAWRRGLELPEIWELINAYFR